MFPHPYNKPPPIFIGDDIFFLMRAWLAPPERRWPIHDIRVGNGVWPVHGGGGGILLHVRRRRRAGWAMRVMVDQMGKGLL